MHYLLMIHADESAVPNLPRMRFPLFWKLSTLSMLNSLTPGETWEASACKPRELQQPSARGMERR